LSLQPDVSVVGAEPNGFPSDGGQLGALIRAFDWSRTSLGPIAQWPACLRTATDIVLRSPLPLMMLWGPDGVMIYNDPYSLIAGQRHPRLLGSRVLEGWAEVAEFNAEVLRVVMAGGTLSFKNQELTLYRNNRPEQVWMDLKYGPVPNEDGRPAGVLAIVVETTGQVRAEAALVAERAVVEEANRRSRLVVNELNHRVKNMLAMIQAIAAQTFRNADDSAAAQTRFSARILALARASDLLTGENWEGVLLADIVGRSAEAAGPGRLIAKGPAVRVSPKTALSLTMAMHELTANAMKYGALSDDRGRIIVEWGGQTDARGERLVLEWRESGGPPVVPPARRGFGSRLIERGLASELGGEVSLRFDPDGLVCRIDAPMAAFRFEA
jgi:two-component sensor histidine kinase